MKKISNDTRENYNLLEELIESNGISGREVLDIFTDYFGLQLCSKDFMENLRDCEGYELPESED